MMANLKIPVGIEDFEEIRMDNCYYIDKTRFIIELLSKKFAVNLITRPRRFGKTLMMNMLRHFFDIRKDSRHLFEGLEIAKEKEICKVWLNQCPVLFLSFKDVAKEQFSKSYEQLAFTISNLCMEHTYLNESDKVDEDDKEIFIRLKKRIASNTELENSLFILMRMLKAYYEKKVILLIDEYDVPLAKADEYGYYNEMLSVIRGIMGTALKSNDCLRFAVITGCLKIAKESIFTGTNHFVNHSIDRGSYMDLFGFTEIEVRELLQEAGFEQKLPEIKKWYNGYQFGNYEIYCPWDVVNYVSELLDNPYTMPNNYWKDTSHNNIIRRFIGNKKFHVNEKFETLLSGGSIVVNVIDNLTYDFDNSTEDNFWSILYLTGYLTKEKNSIVTNTTTNIKLKIPNEEVKMIFEDTIVTWFQDTMKIIDNHLLMQMLWEGKEEIASGMIAKLLRQTISYHNYKEDFYHAFLAGIFVGAGYLVESDKEHGEGRPDVVVKDNVNQRVIMFEIKRSIKEKDMGKDCLRAVNQMIMRDYKNDFLEDYETIICYGIAFYKKKCCIKKIEVGL